MKRIIAVWIGFFMLASCSYSVFYRQPQPAGGENLTSFPKKIRGTYIMNNEHTCGLINSNILYWLSISDSLYAMLSDSLILRKLKSHYLLNVRQKDQYEGDFLWHVYLIEYNRKKDHIKVKIIVDNKNIDKNDIFARISKVLVFTLNNDQRHIIDPTTEEMKKLIDNNCFRLLYCFKAMGNGNFLHIFAFN